MEELGLFAAGMLMFFGFLASFIDSVVGGGGLIAMPTLLFFGLPPQVAIATNKFASFFSLLTSMTTFIRSGKIDFKVVGKYMPLAFVGALLGAYIVHFVSPDILKPLILILLIVVAVYTVFNRRWGQRAFYKKLSKKRMVLFGALLTILAFYDGFFGPGAGSFYIFSFLMIGFDFLQAAGSAKAINFGSNVGALLMFLLLGSVNFLYGVPMAVGMIAGAYAGSKFAIKKGSRYVRILFIAVTTVLIAKNLFDYIQGFFID